MQEIWKTIPFATDYSVSSFGRVKSSRRGRETFLSLTRVSSTDNHLNVKIIVDKDRKVFKVHRLVMLVFCPIDHPELYEVNHKDGNPQNNHLDNLEWVTSKQNHEHYKNILIPQRKQDGTFTVGKKKKFYKITFSNNITNYYVGYEGIKEELGISSATVIRWRNGEYSNYVKSVEEVQEIPEGWVNTPIEHLSPRKMVHIEYYKKPEEIYENCREADRALGLEIGTIQRWAKRDWSKTNSGKAGRMGICRVWREE